MSVTHTGTSGDPRIGWSSTETPPHPHPPATAATAYSPPSPPPSPSAAPPSPAPPPAATSRPPCTRSSRTSSTPSPTPSATASPAAAPKPSCISRHITAADADRSKRAARKPLTNGEARSALKHAKLTARRIREDGDPLHGSYAPPCRSCTALSDHFGVRIVDPTAQQG